MNKMEKNSSERLLKQLIAALKLEGNQMPGGVLESDDYNIIIIKPNQLQQENAGEKQVENTMNRTVKIKERILMIRMENEKVRKS